MLTLIGSVSQGCNGQEALEDLQIQLEPVQNPAKLPLGILTAVKQPTGATHNFTTNLLDKQNVFWSIQQFIITLNHFG